MIKITKEEYVHATGESLHALDGLDDSSNKIPRYINEVATYIYDYVNENSQFPIPDDEDLSEFQIKKIKEAQIQQGKYWLDNGNLTNKSGYDENSGVNITREYLNTIGISPEAEKKLHICGLLNRNIRHSMYQRPPFSRWYK